MGFTGTDLLRVAPVSRIQASSMAPAPTSGQLGINAPTS